VANCLYLVSSSASREYIADCVEALALPRGMVHHFRYQRRHVDEPLGSILKTTPGDLPAELKDMRVVVVYVYQEHSGGKWTPGSYLPLRYGRLLESYLDGDVAHFYFEVTDYVKGDGAGRSARDLLNAEIHFKRSGAEDAKPSFAHCAKDLDLAADPSKDSLEFQHFVDAYVPGEWRTRSLGATPLDVTYDVIFVRVEGLFFEREGRLEKVSTTPHFTVGNPFAEYQLRSGISYYVKVMTYFSNLLPAQLPGRGRAKLRIDFDREIVKSEGITSFPLTSNYDLHFLPILPDCHSNRRTVLKISCEHAIVPTDDFLRREVLCPEILLPISVVVA
jgi:hypothetical protein